MTNLRVAILYLSEQAKLMLEGPEEWKLKYETRRGQGLQ